MEKEFPTELTIGSKTYEFTGETRIPEVNEFYLCEDKDGYYVNRCSHDWRADEPESNWNLLERLIYKLKP